MYYLFYFNVNIGEKMSKVNKISVFTNVVVHAIVSKALGSNKNISLDSSKNLQGSVAETVSTTLSEKAG
jgi:hypothetical protein